MSRCTIALSAVAFVLSIFGTIDVSAAAAQRTFVASNGNDANPCSLVLPCRSFAAAIAQTLGAGEVIVLNSAGYGPVTITQSISIVVPSGVYAGISVPAGKAGVAIAGAGISVVLRGLTINSTGGEFGIFMTNGAELTVENCVITNFANGIAVAVAIPAIVKIAGTVMRDNGQGVAVGNGTNASITNSQIVGNRYQGIRVAGLDVGTTTNVVIADTLITGAGSGHATACVHNASVPANVTGNIFATRVTVTGCDHDFTNESQTVGTIAVSDSMVTGNNYGFANSPPNIFRSLGNNHLSGNTNDTVGTITTISPM